MSKKPTQEEAEKKVNDKCIERNYTLIKPFIYLNNTTILQLKCNIDDNKWPITYTKFMCNRGCPECALNKRINNRKLPQKEVQKRVLNRCKEMNFTLLNTLYDTTTRIFLRCNIDGNEWDVNYNNFIFQKNGCSKCSDKYSPTTDEFIVDANKIHNNFYSYSKFIYVSAFVHGIITCPIHGDFPKTPDSHLQGSGCPDCGVIKSANTRRKTIKQFIEVARNVHGDKYDYSKVVYVNPKTNIEIICSIHGQFPQRPDHHLRGSGCDKCAKESGITTSIKKYGEAWLNKIPKYNPNSIIYLDQISEKLDVKIQHALNGGEKKFHRYFVDGYISDYNICIEWMEKHHYQKKHREKDLIRENYIKDKFDCHFININEKEFLKNINNQINIVVDKIKQIINN